MFVEQLLPAAIAWLVTMADDASLRQVAQLFHAGTDLVVVCGTGGALVGVITKTDVVAWLGDCQGGACMAAAGLVMSVDVLRCGLRDLVHDVWLKMQARNVKNVPIVGGEGCLLGVLNVRDAIGALLQDANYEEFQLQDCVMGVGYR